MKPCLYVLVAFFMLGCSSDDDTETQQNPFQNIEADILGDIGFFINAGEDDTSTFESYAFDFPGDGTVIVSSDLLSATGSWYKDESPEIFQLSFAGGNPSKPFDRLTENWEITAASSTTIQLVYETVDVNKTLTFTKIQ